MAGKFPVIMLLICILSAIFMSKLDDYIVSIALPHIAEQFKVSTSDVSLITLVYMLSLTSTIIIWGALGDKIGFKKTIISGYILFSISSLLCGLSASIIELIIFRFIQGFGASILLVSSQAMISTYFTGNLKAKAYGLLTLAASVGMTLGPSLGGIIAEYLSWQWIFYVNVPVGILIVLLSIKYIPELPVNKVENTQPAKKFDFTGSFLIFMTLASIVFTLNKGQELGWTSLAIIVSICLSILFLTAFLIAEKKHPYPLIDFGLLKNIHFTYAVLSAFLSFILIGGNLFLMPFYLTIVCSLNYVSAGLVMTVYPAFFMVSSLINIRIIDKFTSRFLCTGAMIITLCSWTLFTMTLHEGKILHVIIFLALTGTSLGFFFAPNTRYAMDLVTSDKAGLASGIYRTLNNFGMILGISIFETVYSVIIPHDHHIKNTSSLLMHHLPGLQITGFQYAYLVGTFLCLIALILIIINQENNNCS